MRLFIVLLLLCGISGFVCVSLKAQNNGAPDIIPPSPTTREFDKYITYNVSLYNGLPQINIPLYEIKIKGLTIPISLSYHASGIRYKQTSGEVGVGWVLNPRYRISKTIHGPDDARNNVLPNPMPDPGTAYATMTERDQYLASFCRPDIFLPPASHQPMDGQYDIYRYEVQSESGTFIEADRHTRNFEFLDSRKMKVIKAPTEAEYYFDVVDGNGVTYRMGKNLNRIYGTMEVHDIGLGEVTGVGWFATQIITPFNESVQIDYISRQVYEDQAHLRNAVLQQYVGTLHFGSPGTPVAFPTSPLTYSSPSNIVYSTSLINTINTGIEKIIFHHDEQGLLLRRIEIKDQNEQLIREIVFSYSENTYYTLLNKVSIYPADNSEPQVYSFEYYPGNASVLQTTFDNWGFIHNNSPTGFNSYKYILPTVLGEETGLYENVNHPASGGLTEYTFYDKIVTSDPIDWSLKRVIYPTGGYSEYAYESNQYQSASGPKKGHGLRIKTISSNDLVNGTTLIKEYRYGENESGSGLSNLDIEPGDFVTTGLFSMGIQANNTIYKGLGAQIMYSNQPGNEAISDGDAKLFYPEVNEYMKDLSGVSLGKTQYQFGVPSLWFSRYDRYASNTASTLVSLEPYGNGFFSPGINRGRHIPRMKRREAPWVKPHLIATRIYTNANGSFTLIRKDTTIYNELVRDTFTGLKVKPFLSGGDYQYQPVNGGYSPYSNVIASLFDYGTYFVFSGNVLPIQKEITHYSPNGSLTIQQKFTYNQADQIIEQEVSDSRSGSIITEYKYPVDFQNLTSTDEVTEGIKRLQYMNILEPTVEESSWRKNDAGAKSLISAQFTTFKATTPSPGEILRIENSSLLNDFARSSVQSGTVVKDNRYKQRMSFELYDIKGNLLQQKQTDDIVYSYIWAYHHNYPVAEVKNATYQEIVNILGQSVLDLLNSNPGTDEEIRAILQGLRDAPDMQQATITSYTFKPLVGITSKTDPNGQTTYFEYDAFGRLQTISDNGENVLKTFFYHFREH